MTAPTARLPRTLHPGAWWLWAIGMATAASLASKSRKARARAVAVGPSTQLRTLGRLMRMMRVWFSVSVVTVLVMSWALVHWMVRRCSLAQ